MSDDRSFQYELPGFDVSVRLKRDRNQTAPPDFQLRWMLNRAVREFSDDLDHLYGQMQRFVPGSARPAIAEDWQRAAAHLDEQELVIQDQQVMQAWERPLMRAMAQSVTRTGGDILEVGFGMGISASMILESGVRSYTVIECNDAVIDAFEGWRHRYPEKNVRLIRGRWQDVRDQLDHYDGILFDTYPLSQQEYERNETNGRAYTHAGEFFPLAAELLRPGGLFSYFSCEIDTLSRGHQRLLLQHFDSFQVSLQTDLKPPTNCQYWWSESMVVVNAFKSPDTESD